MQIKKSEENQQDEVNNGKKEVHKKQKKAARLSAKTANQKLAPIDHVEVPYGDGRRRPVPRGPFMSATYSSVRATCPASCPLRDNGCFAQGDFTRRTMMLLDEAAVDMSADEVIEQEARLIERAFRGGRIPQDGARGGRDLRLHVGGDVRTEAQARRLARAAERWLRRGGGSVWTFTHAWRDVPREAWGPIVVTASCELPEDIEVARARGYGAALVVPAFADGGKGYRLPETSTVIVPCRAEVTGTTCAECRLCVDDGLFDKGVTIGFEAHGGGRRKVIEKLVRLRFPTAARESTSMQLTDGSEPSTA